MIEFELKNRCSLEEYIYGQVKQGKYVTVALYYNEAVKLIKGMLNFEDVNIEYARIYSPEYYGYEKEYYVSVFDDVKIGVEPAYCDDGKRYLRAGADLYLFDEDVDNRIKYDNLSDTCKSIKILNKDKNKSPICDFG